MATMSDLLGLTPVADSIFQMIIPQIRIAEKINRIFMKVCINWFNAMELFHQHNTQFKSQGLNSIYFELILCIRGIIITDRATVRMDNIIFFVLIKFNSEINLPQIYYNFFYTSTDQNSI